MIATHFKWFYPPIQYSCALNLLYKTTVDTCSSNQQPIWNTTNCYTDIDVNVDCLYKFKFKQANARCTWTIIQDSA